MRFARLAGAADGPTRDDAGRPGTAPAPQLPQRLRIVVMFWPDYFVACTVWMMTA
jgi:hypothetical protein